LVELYLQFLYVFVAWCLIKHKDNLALLYYLHADLTQPSFSSPVLVDEVKLTEFLFGNDKTLYNEKLIYVLLKIQFLYE
jgi:hypothetical protein